MEQGKKNYYIAYAVISMIISAIVVFVPDNIRSGFFMKLVGFVLASGFGFVGFVIGDFLRRLAAPDLIFTSGGFWPMFKARMFWMCGPQLIGIVIGSLIAAALVLDTGKDARRVEEAAALQRSMIEAEEWRQSQTRPTVEDSLDVQVKKFLRPPSPERTVNDWTIMDPAEESSGGWYVRVATDDAMETGCRLGFNLLLLDYSSYNRDLPRLNIAIEPMSSIEEVMPDYANNFHCNVYVDDHFVGETSFKARPSAQNGYILLEQDHFTYLDTIYASMKEGQVVTFKSTANDERFDFDIAGLREVEDRVWQ